MGWKSLMIREEWCLRWQSESLKFASCEVHADALVSIERWRVRTIWTTERNKSFGGIAISAFGQLRIC
jgi:hypothetical protein